MTRTLFRPVGQHELALISEDRRNNLLLAVHKYGHQQDLKSCRLVFNLPGQQSRLQQCCAHEWDAQQ